MKKCVLRLMQATGVFAATRAMSGRMARILMYHDFSETNVAGAVSIAAVKDQLEYLRRHFSIVPLSEIAGRVRSGDTIGNRLVALTVDDGRLNFHEHLFPLLKKLNLCATLFVVSSFINAEDWIWTDKVLWLSDQPRRPSALEPKGLDRLFHQLNQLSPGNRTGTIEQLAAQMQVNIPQTPPPKYAACSWKQLREMANSGLVEIGSHTMTHPILASVSDETSLHEMTASRVQIEREIGRNVRYFCYPNGQKGDYRPIQVRQIQDAGYEAAVTACNGLISHGTDVYELPRIGVAGSTDPVSFRKHVDGADHYQVKVQRFLGLS